MKILIADDSKFMRLMIRRICDNASEDIETEEAGTGIEAVKKNAVFAPDLIFMDITMPQMNGIEAMQRIKKVSPDCKLVICSALANAPQIKEAIEQGADEIIAKPFQEEKILEVIKLTKGR